MTRLVWFVAGAAAGWFAAVWWWRAREQETVDELERRLAAASSESSAVREELEAATTAAQAARRAAEAARAEAEGYRAEAEAARAEAEAAQAEVRRAKRSGDATESPATSGDAGGESDDLTRIEGIGPKIAGILAEAGITTYAALAATPVERLRELLDAAGPRFRMHDPTTWPEQAHLAASGEWDALEELQERLVGGRAG